jgi:hypothetical protein
VLLAIVIALITWASLWARYHCGFEMSRLHVFPAIRPRYLPDGDKPSQIGDAK